MILPLVLDYLSHSLENLTFIPDPTALSFVFHEIVIVCVLFFVANRKFRKMLDHRITVLPKASF